MTIETVTDVDALTRRVRSLLAERGSRCGTVTLVAVDGPSGSGKTTLAGQLGEELDALVLHVDDMHQGWTGLLETVSIARSSLVDAWLRDEPASHPTWDWDDSVRGADVAVPRADLIVLEGVGAFAIAGHEASAKVWVQAPDEDRQSRAIARDGEVFASHWDVWADQERRLYTAAPGLPDADIVLDTGAAPPDDGFDAGPSMWLVVLGVIAVSLSMRTLMTSLPPLLPRIRDDLGLSSVWLGVLTTLPVLCMGLLAPAAARLGLRLGVVRCISIAMVAVAIGNLARVLGAHAVGSLYIGTLCAGAGIALAGTLLPGMVKAAFPANRAGLATGLQMFAMMGGAAVAAAVSVPLADALGDWDLSLGFWGVVAAIGLLLWLPVDRAVHRGGDHDQHPPDLSHRLPWRSATAWCVAAYLAVQSWQFYSTLAWLSPTYVGQGWAPQEAGILLAVFTGVQFVSGMVGPALTDRVGDWRIVLVAVGLCGLAGQLGVWAAPDAAPWLWVVLLGIAQGASFAIGLVLLVRYAVSPAAAARFTAMAFLVCYTVASMGPTTMGAVRDLTGGYSAIFLVLALLMLVQLTLTLLLRPGRAPVQ
ncbi:MFS transporter [Knoellia sinensis KCTC 19936]|uniref:MFS transporter n=1 Tax=Knoellia sinensis KCTC 19936 TaxID=1385520 RepID=A0A0A0J942_9MICO|nr:MFS transporter [Knoellia sinensis]KGN32522.1 MFS transporter [Knoellia sinensis KCTC 19936]